MLRRILKMTGYASLETMLARLGNQPVTFGTTADLKACEVTGNVLPRACRHCDARRPFPPGGAGFSLAG